MLTLNPQPDGASLLRCYSGKALLAAPLAMVQTGGQTCTVKASCDSYIEGSQ